MSSFHKTNLGRFGESLPCDIDGYVHTTIKGWMAANVDFAGQRMTQTELRDWAREQASEARNAVKQAEADLAGWRQANG